MGMKLCVFGGRDFTNYDYVKEVLKDLDIDEIVCGGAKGADYLGAWFAKDNDITISLFEANWDKYGRSAGPMRNAEMSEYCTDAIGFWDGRSSGTGHMRETCKKMGKPVEIFSYTNIQLHDYMKAVNIDISLLPDETMCIPDEWKEFFYREYIDKYIEEKL